MAFNISNDGIIKLTRGDTVQLPLFINKGTAMQPVRYELQDGDEVYLALMQPNQYFEDAILKKKFTKDNLNDHGDVLIRFESEDTVQLIPGKYYYQIKAKFLNVEGNYDVNTLVERTQFIILE